MDLLSLILPWFLGIPARPLAAPSAGRANQPQLRVRLLRQIPVPDTLLRAAGREATRIWAPHMRLSFDDPTAPEDQYAPPPDLIAIVSNKLVGSRPAADATWQTDLAAIGFYAPNTPSNLIQVFYPGVVRLARGALLSGTPISRWPTRLADEAIARVLGRVLAHEVGHFVLRSSQHSPTGLMRGTHVSGDFVAFSAGGFRLTPADVIRFERLFGEPAAVAAAP